MTNWPLKVIAGKPDRPLVIGDIEIDCYVLEDETRVITRAGMLRAIGRAPKAKGGRKYDKEFKLPVFLTAKNLKPFISKEIEENSKPILFRYENHRMIGHRATALPDVCEVILSAKDHSKLLKSQQHIAVQCELIMRGLARVGIVALVDEATGYQEIRARKALATILERFIADELQPWTKTFPYEFYKQIFKLKRWPGPDGVKRPSVIGHYTNDIVYERVAPGVLEELKKLNPALPGGGRKWRHHQWFKPDLGYIKLNQHIAAVIALMRASPNWNKFQSNLKRAFPKLRDQLDLDLED